MTRSRDYFIAYRRFLNEITQPDPRPPRRIPAISRVKGMTRSAQIRLGRLRAGQIFDRIMKGGPR